MNFLVIFSFLSQNLQQNLSNKVKAERGIPYCNCQNKATCVMAVKCVNSNMVYRFYVTRADNNTTEAYTGCTWNFKRRHDAHIRSMNSDTKSTTLSTHVKSLKRRNIPHNIRWQFKEHASPFNHGTWWCRLCTLEKYYILFEPEEASLNQRSEFFQHCYHQEPQLLVKKWYAFLQIFQLQLFFHKLNNFISYLF